MEFFLLIKKSSQFIFNEAEGKVRAKNTDGLPSKSHK